MAEPLLAVRGLTKSYDGWSKALALATRAVGGWPLDRWLVAS